jgi:hypothetical protein
MNITHRSLTTLFICLFSLSITTAQQGGSTTTQSPVPIVTATATTERVRYASLGEVHQSRLQVFSAAGTQVYDSGLRLGNLVDWQLQNQQGQRLPDGAYLSLLTITNFSGRVTQKYGSVVLEEGQVYLQHSSREDLSTAQASALDASKQAESFTAFDRIGAAGLNRAALVESGSNTTSDGTQISGTTSSASVPVDTPPSAVSGTGTANKIVKWLDSAGALIDSNLFEDAGSRVGLGTTNLSDILLAGNDKFKIVDGAMTFSFRDFSSGEGYFAIGSSTNGIKGFVGHTNTADGFTLGSFSNHKVTLRTNSVNRLTIDTSGNVGIGTTTPTAKLHVLGDVNFTGLRTEVTGNTPNVIGGHSDNWAMAGVVAATIGGGGYSYTVSTSPNSVTDAYGTVGGGVSNKAGNSTGTTVDSAAATVGGGIGNTAGGSSATVGGGRLNDAIGSSSTVPGGFFNTAQGNYSFAAGSHAGAFHQGSFVWSDSTTTSGFFSSTANNQFLINATGGVGIGTNTPKDRLDIQGGNLLLGSPGKGIILKSPDGTVCRLLTIDNAGTLVNSLVACP